MTDRHANNAEQYSDDGAGSTRIAMSDDQRAAWDWMKTATRVYNCAYAARCGEVARWGKSSLTARRRAAEARLVMESAQRKLRELCNWY